MLAKKRFTGCSEYQTLANGTIPKGSFPMKNELLGVLNNIPQIFKTSDKFISMTGVWRKFGRRPSPDSYRKSLAQRGMACGQILSKPQSMIRIWTKINRV
jgi:hypothetical protein